MVQGAKDVELDPWVNEAMRTVKILRLGLRPDTPLEAFSALEVDELLAVADTIPKDT